MPHLSWVILCMDLACTLSLQENWWTPLHVAAYFGHKDVVALLLDMGANVDAIETVSEVSTMCSSSGWLTQGG
jgi:hypothetical protein